MSLGIGMSSRATAGDVRAAIDAVLAEAGWQWDDVDVVATRRHLAADARLTALGKPVVGFDDDALAAVDVLKPSAAGSQAAAIDAAGTQAAAIDAAGTQAAAIDAAGTQAAAIDAGATPAAAIDAGATPATDGTPATRSPAAARLPAGPAPGSYGAATPAAGSHGSVTPEAGSHGPGTPAPGRIPVAEPAALLAAGAGAELVVPKRTGTFVTVAAANA